MSKRILRIFTLFLCSISNVYVSDNSEWKVLHKIIEEIKEFNSDYKPITVYFRFPNNKSFKVDCSIDELRRYYPILYLYYCNKNLSNNEDNDVYSDCMIHVSESLIRFNLCINELSHEKRDNIFGALSAAFNDIFNKTLQKYQKLNKTEIVDKLKFYYNKYSQLFISTNNLQKISLKMELKTSSDDLELDSSNNEFDRLWYDFECIINKKKNKKLDTEYKTYLNY